MDSIAYHMQTCKVSQVVCCRKSFAKTKVPKRYQNHHLRGSCIHINSIQRIEETVDKDPFNQNSLGYQTYSEDASLRPDRQCLTLVIMAYYHTPCCSLARDQNTMPAFNVTSMVFIIRPNNHHRNIGLRDTLAYTSDNLFCAILCVKCNVIYFSDTNRFTRYLRSIRD